MQNPESSFQWPISSKKASVSTSSDPDREQENQSSRRNSDSVETIIIGLRLPDRESAPGQTSASPKPVRESPLKNSPSSAATRHAAYSSSSLQESPRSLASAVRLNAAAKAEPHKSTGNKSRGGVPPSPSSSRLNNRGIPGKALLAADLSFTGGFFDHDSEGKRTRGLSNFLRPIFRGRASSKGERQNENNQRWDADIALDNPVYTKQDSMSKGNTERDRLEQVRIAALSSVQILMLP